MFDYKGYRAIVEPDMEAGVLHGEVAGIRDVVTFEAADMATLKDEFQASVDDYLEMCAEEGIEPNKPCSGKFQVRMDPDVHLQLDMLSSVTGQSINSLILDTIDTHLVRKVRTVRKTHTQSSQRKTTADLARA